MVLKVPDYRKPKLLKEIEQEKNNMMYCMKPAVSVDKEEAFFKYYEANSPTRDEILTRLQQAKLEETKLKPLPISIHYNCLKKKGGWEKL